MQRVELLRHLSNDDRTFLNQHADVLAEMAAYCTQAIDTAFKVERTGHHLLPGMLMYRHVAETLWAIESLVRAGWADPSRVTLRTLFEGHVQLEHLLAEDQKRRGCAYLVCGLFRALNEVERGMAGHELNKNLRAKIGRDRFLKRSSMNWASGGLANAEHVRLTQMLAQPQYAEAVAEYERLRQLRRRTPPWYALWNEKVDSLEGLTRAREMEGVYELVYRWMSSYAHANDAVAANVGVGKDRLMSIRQIRSFGGISDITVLASSLAAGSTEIFLRRYLETMSLLFGKWYATEHKEKVDAIKELADNQRRTASDRRQEGG